MCKDCREARASVHFSQPLIHNRQASAIKQRKAGWAVCPKCGTVWSTGQLRGTR
jgi:hypothetical protein